MMIKINNRALCIYDEISVSKSETCLNLEGLMICANDCIGQQCWEKKNDCIGQQCCSIE